MGVSQSVRANTFLQRASRSSKSTLFWTLKRMQALMTQSHLKSIQTNWKPVSPVQQHLKLSMMMRLHQLHLMSGKGDTLAGSERIKCRSRTRVTWLPRTSLSNLRRSNCPTTSLILLLQKRLTLLMARPARTGASSVCKTHPLS